MKDISAVTFAVQSFVTLFVIMDPPGATPIFLGLVADKSPRVRRILAIQAAAVSLLVISIFALFGRAILNYLNISMEALQAAGALLLLFANSFAAYATASALTSGTIPLVPLQIGSLVSGNVIADKANLGYALGFGMVIIIGIVMTGYAILQRKTAKWLSN